MTGREDIFQKAMSEGHSQAWDQNWEQAAAAYRKALKEFPENPKAMTSLGLALIQLQKYDEALKMYLQAARLTPEDPMPLDKAAMIHERLGEIPQTIQYSMKAAELFAKNQNVEKAIENWLRVTMVDPEAISAHQYLAMVHEKMGHTSQAVTEYLALASLYQRTGNNAKAAELVGRSLRIEPGNQEARQAQNILKAGQLLPKPMRPKGGTGALRMAQVKTMDTASRQESRLDPVAEARQKALTRMAEVLFEYSDDSGEASSKRGMTAIVKGTGPLNRQDTRAMILLHLSQAIDSQTKGDENQAIAELEHALETGFNEPAVEFDLGMLHISSGNVENGLRHLQRSIKHDDYALGARLLMAAALEGMNRLQAAGIEYLEALKLADIATVDMEHADMIAQLYEPLIEAQSTHEDPATATKLCENIRNLLNQENWRGKMREAREQLPKQEDDTPLPVADILIQAQSSQVIEAISRVHQYAREGYLRSAMEEAYFSLQTAPNYLPLHTLIGDLLIQEGQQDEAIEKFTVVAQAYSIRGETAQATKMLRRIVDVSPMDMNVRSRLVDHLVARGQVDEAMGEFLDLADMQYRLADLDQARKTYATALRHAQQSSKNQEWSIKILQRMADIDIQRLDWKQALRILEQIRTLRPDDMSVRKNLIDLNSRLNQTVQAETELENFITYLDNAGQRMNTIPFLEEMLRENPEDALLVRSLAGEYHHAGQTTEALEMLDKLGNTLLDAGDPKGAIRVIETIIAMDPPNAADYRKSLEMLKKR